MNLYRDSEEFKAAVQQRNSEKLERDSALTEFKIAVQQRNSAEKRYAKAIRRAFEAGISNSMLASVAHTTEAAIRMYRKRHGL